MRFLLVSLCSLLVICSCGDSKKEKDDVATIKEILNEYSDAVVRYDFEAMADFVYPGVLDKGSKERMIADAKDGMDNENFKIEIHKIYTDSISRIFNEGKNRYAFSQNRTDASFIIKGHTDDSTRQNKLYNKFCSDFIKAYGESNVKCNNHQKAVTVFMKGVVYFIYDAKYAKWFVLADSDPEYVKKFIPSGVRDEVK